MRIPIRKSMSTAPKDSLRFSEVSTSLQMLIRICQVTNFGSIESLAVRDGEPLFNPPPVVMADIKLDGDEEVRPELMLADFVLCSEVRRIMNQLNRLKNGTIERIEIHAGIPRRLAFRVPFPEAVLGDHLAHSQGSGTSRSMGRRKQAWREQ